MNSAGCDSRRNTPKALIDKIAVSMMCGMTGERTYLDRPGHPESAQVNLLVQSIHPSMRKTRSKDVSTRV